MYSQKNISIKIGHYALWWPLEPKVLQLSYIWRSTATWAPQGLSNVFFPFPPSYNTFRDIGPFLESYTDFSKVWPFLTFGDPNYELTEKMTEIVSFVGTFGYIG